MATIKSLAEFIHRRLEGGDVLKDSQIDRREIEFAILRVLNSLLKIEFYNSMKTPDDDRGFSAQFIFCFDAKVEEDKDRNEKFISIPVSYIDLPNGKGILEIRNRANASKAFIPIPPNSWSLISSIPAGRLEQNTGFYPEGKRVYLVNCNKVDKVIVKLAVATGQDLTIDPAMEFEVMNTVLGLFKQVPQDRINNENKTPQI